MNIILENSAAMDPLDGDARALYCESSAMDFPGFHGRLSSPRSGTLVGLRADAA